MSKRKLSQRLLAMLLTVVMVLGLMPITASADVSSLSSDIIIYDFKGLTEEIVNQTVPFGTTLEALNLPDTLEVVVQEVFMGEARVPNLLNKEEEDLPVTVESNVIDEQTNQGTEDTIVVPVTWSADPEYNGEQAGTYIFTPVLPEVYSLSYGVYAPEIWVTVQEKGPDTNPVTGSIYTVSMAPTTETNISWTDLSNKFGNGTIKDGDTLKILNAMPLISDLLIPETISELTIEGIKDIVWPLHIETYAENMKLTLKDIGLRTTSKEAIIFNADTELVIEGNVIVESSKVAIRSGYGVIISGSGDMNANCMQGAWAASNAFTGESLTVNSTGTLIFNGGDSKDGNGSTGIVCDNFTLESGTVIANGGGSEVSGSGYTGGHGIDSDILTVRGDSTLKANGGNSLYGGGGDGIYSALNVTLEAGTVTVNGGDAGMGYDHILNNNGLYTAQLIVNGESNLTARGGNATQGVGGNGIICDNIILDGSGNIQAFGGNNINVPLEKSKGLSVSPMAAVTINGTGSIQFQDGMEHIVSLLNKIRFTTTSGKTWSVDPASNLISGNFSSEEIVVKASTTAPTTVKLESENKPIITIIDKREDITVTEGMIHQNISVWATASVQTQLKYQWFTSQSRSNIEGIPLVSEKSSVFYLPEILVAGEYYIYCEISAEGADSVKTDVVKVTVLPKQNEGPFAGGDGSPETPYLIETAGQLAKLAQLVNSKDSMIYSTKYYELMNNIDLSEYADDGGWIPIGKSGTYIFRGHFEGNGHVITGLTINNSSDNCQGLFGSVYNGTIQNLGLTSVDINGGVRVGGLVGYMDKTGSIQNCYVTGSVTGKMNVGGLVGFMVSSVTIDTCYTTTTVSGSMEVGGIAGTVSGGTIENSYAIGNVSGSNNDIGGIAGRVYNNGMLRNCGAYNSTVTGNDRVGRVCGSTEESIINGNFAAGHMAVIVNGIPQTIIGGALNQQHGETISAEQLSKKSGFPSTLTQSPWVYTEGVYPVLSYVEENLIAGQVWVFVPTVEIDWDSLKETIESYRGGIGTFTADVNKEEKTVTVTGSIRGAKNYLELTIPKDVTVIWKAKLDGDNSFTVDLLRLEGEGAFELVEGGEISMYGANEGNGISAQENFSNIIINGGNVSVNTGQAIITYGQDTSVTVLSGRVGATDGTAIYVHGSNSVVSVSGGVVEATRGTAISSYGEIFLSGGIVRNKQGTAVMSEGNIMVSENALITAATGVAVKINSKNSKFILSGGIVFSYFDMGSIIPMGVYVLPNLGTPIVEDTGTMVQWEKTNGVNTYTAGTSNDIMVLKSNATAKWAIINNVSGIMVKSSTNSVFIPVPEVTLEPVAVTVESIQIKSAPAKTTYQAGDTLNLSGLVVTLTMSDGSSEDVSFFGFEKKGITTNPSHGDILDTESTIVHITYSDALASQFLTINQKINNYEVTFNHGGLETVKRTVEEGTSLGSDLWPSDPVKAGYMFGGWYTGENGTGTVFIPNTIVTGDITVYAKWSAIIIIEPVEKDYTVTFSNGGLNVTKVLVKEGTAIGSDRWPRNPVKAGYAFGGWYLGENGTGTVFTPATIVTSDFIVYAKWMVVNSDSDEGSSGNNLNTNSGTSPSTGIEQITAQVKQGDTDSVASQIIIERTTKENGEKSDKVTLQNEKAIETVEKLKAEGKDIARIVIPDAKDEVEETTIHIPVTSLKTLTAGNISLQMDVEEAKIGLPKESVKNASQVLLDDLYFRLVPVKNQTEKDIVSKEARKNAIQVSNNPESTVSIIGNPVTIETNMPSAKTDIILPLTGVVIPSNKAEKEALLKQLAVYIEHSDGDKVLVQGEVVEYKEDVYGIRFAITKFSTFTVVKTDAFIKSAAKDITKLSTPANAVIKGSTVTASVANKTSSLTVKATVSKNAAWTLYLDKDLKKEVVNGKLKLTTGVNTSYIKVTAQDNTTKVYKLTITRNKSSKAEVTKIVVPEKAVRKGSIISATVANEKTSLTASVKVSSKASFKIYSDKALEKEILNGKLNLKEGLNTVYIKVTAENGSTSKVYTLKITRKAQLYKSQVSLGLIGSKEYANKVAEIFRQDYDSANVLVNRKGKYYLVTMDFIDKTAAEKACKEMVNRKYIVNYYFN
ncbi:hypothetical protein acsn021_17620 [Anaerocolumna cellulosilytica]|uniref:Uncharacterized protein n=1 Tax=Anaerocolumna cellulosilytica TaxID=433286 RepID=A0A6S6QS77_9FIRM|nr:InlB B-repeat-containing protein [Anaerocolumna cellulosilytica]MBB5194844.1 putative repeat protein (TIGR02543 family) [Anaerocolumna cellulosilytica]BCJ94193.1 hypothetical protein acsn021_17620 [Anaerocolumna cellulosilytica]